jgi:predicted esterase
MLLLVFLLQTTPPSPTMKRYEEEWKAAQRAMDARNYPLAITHLQEVRKLVPYEPTMQELLAITQAKAGKIEEAFTTLEQAISYGWRDVPGLMNHQDFVWLREHRRYQELLKQAKDAAEEKFVLYAGKSAHEKSPLVLLLHGLGAGPRSELPYWKPLADELGLILVAPKGHTEIATHLVGWHNRLVKDSHSLQYYDPEIAIQPIERVIAEAKAKHPGERPVYLAGYSQGGGLALQLMHRYPEKFQGAIVLASLCQTPGVDHWKSLSKTKLAVLVGKLDKLHERHVKLIEQLEAAKVMFRAESYDQVGHEYPSDFTQRVRPYIEWLLK